MKAEFVAAWPDGLEYWVLYFPNSKARHAVKPLWTLGIVHEVAL